MSAMTIPGMAPTRSGGCLFRRRLTLQGNVKRAQRACRSQNRQLMRGGRP